MVNDRGFTLIELIVAIAIIGILAGIMAMMLRSPAHVVAANDIRAMFQQARIEAVKRNRAVAVTYVSATGDFAVLANDVGNAVSCATNTTLIRSLNLDREHGGVTAAVTLADGFVWLPNGLIRPCTIGTAAGATVVLTYRGQSSTVAVSEAGRVSVQ